MFNTGHLTVETANFLHNIGYIVVCSNGMVEHIFEETDEVQI